MEITLNSLVNQSFQNFEAIIVNDGSTDSTQEIIDKYCNKYSNFKSIIQNNQGVAIARNNAIKIAQGDYLGFLDGDGDCFQEDALEHFNNTLLKYNNPDLVIGRQTLIDPWSKVSFQNAKKLSNLDEIMPYDERILWTMSLTNKVFSREKILSNNLKMPKLTHASDGIFTFSFVYSCDSIVGCPHEILVYNKRLFLNENSLSQASKMETIEDYFKSFEIILEKFKSYAENYKRTIANDDLGAIKEFESIYINYLNTLMYRETTVLFIDQIYRFFWRMDRNIILKSKEIINFFKENLFTSSWNKIEKNNEDLNINNLMVDRKLMAENPIITVVINDFEENTLNRIITNLYSSTFPSFEIILSNDSFDKLNEDFKNKENLKMIENSLELKNTAINIAKGDYILFIDEDVLISLKTLKEMFKKLKNSDHDFLVSSIDYLSYDNILNQKYEINDFSKKEIVFSNPNYDHYFSNKLINLDFLKKNDFSFTNDNIQDVKRLYDFGSFTRIKNNYILTNDENFKNPFISVIIDEMDISRKNFNLLIDSIYSQNFNSFDLIINEELKNLIDPYYLKKSNITFLNNKNFKKSAIEISKSKYGIFIDLQVFYNPSTFKELFFKAEEGNYTFSSSPIYQVEWEIENNDLTEADFDTQKMNKEFNFTNLKKKEIRYFSSQELIYSHKNIIKDSNRSKFKYLDLYSSNKLITLEYLRNNNLFINENKIYNDILYMYNNGKFIKMNSKMILTEMGHSNLIKSIKNSYNSLVFKLICGTHKLFFVVLTMRRGLKNGAK